MIGQIQWFSSPMPYDGIIEYRFAFTSDIINTNKDGWMIDNPLVQNNGVGISELTDNSLFYIFPNPTSDFISIQSNNQSLIKTITITNGFGQIYLTTDKATIDLSYLRTGIYFLKITTDKGEFETKVLRR